MGLVGASVHRVGVEIPDDGNRYTRHLRVLDVPETTFTDSDLTNLLGLGQGVGKVGG